MVDGSAKYFLLKFNELTVYITNQFVYPVQPPSIKEDKKKKAATEYICDRFLAAAHVIDGLFSISILFRQSCKNSLIIRIAFLLNRERDLIEFLEASISLYRFKNFAM
jgi:hypothetical protein